MQPRTFVARRYVRQSVSCLNVKYPKYFHPFVYLCEISCACELGAAPILHDYPHSQYPAGCLLA